MWGLRPQAGVEPLHPVLSLLAIAIPINFEVEMPKSYVDLVAVQFPIEFVDDCHVILILCFWAFYPCGWFAKEIFL